MKWLIWPLFKKVNLQHSKRRRPSFSKRLELLMLSLTKQLPSEANFWLWWQSTTKVITSKADLDSFSYSGLLTQSAQNTLHSVLRMWLWSPCGSEASKIFVSLQEISNLQETKTKGATRCAKCFGERIVELPFQNGVRQSMNKLLKWLSWLKIIPIRCRRNMHQERRSSKNKISRVRPALSESQQSINTT